MRILHTTARYRKDTHGVSGVVRNLVDALEQDGHEVRVMAPQRAEVPRENGVMRVPMDARGGVDARTLTRARGLRPDLIHIHDSLALSGPALTLARRLDIPVVFTLHGPDRALTRRSKKFAAWKARDLVASAADLVVAPSAGARRLARPDVLRSGLSVIENGVAASYLEAEHNREPGRTRRGLEPGQFVVGLVSGDRSPAELGVFLEALEGLLRKSPSVRLLVTGTGTFRTRVLDCLAPDLVEQAVLEEPTPNSDSLRDWIDCLDLMAAPSLEDAEGRGAMRSLARGVPVLAPRSAPWAALLQEAETGFLVSDPSVQGYRSTLERARKVLRRTGRRMSLLCTEAVHRWTLARSAARHGAAYETLLRKHREDRGQASA